MSTSIKETYLTVITLHQTLQPTKMSSLNVFFINVIELLTSNILFWYKYTPILKRMEISVRHLPDRNRSYQIMCWDIGWDHGWRGKPFPHILMSQEVIKHIQVGRRERKKLKEELIVGCIRFRKLFHRDFFPWLKVHIHITYTTWECRVPWRNLLCRVQPQYIQIAFWVIKQMRPKSM